MELLEGVVQHYSWGGYSYIPALLGKAGKARKPHAELWFGAHPKAPAMLGKGRSRQPLSALEPGLPYLLKVLDAREMLSIQSHPTRAQARKGFAAEDAAGIALDAPHRNYKDQNHKPEVHVALTPFWMLHGFRHWEEVQRAVRETPEFRPLRARSMKALVREVLELPSPQSILQPLLQRLAAEQPQDRQQPGYWVLRAAKTYPEAAQDPGLFFLYFLNILYLQAGQGTYQPAGVLHAYLEGTNVELMANSDNVLRAGLTTKHIDAAELLRTATFTTGRPAILKGEAAGPGERVYRTPSKEFELRRLQLSPGKRRRRNAQGPVILLLIEGDAELQNAAGSVLALRRGQSAFLRDEAIHISAGAQGAVFFEARVPG